MTRFDRNQKEFPSFAHRTIWDNGLLLMPPEVSLAGFPDTDKRKNAFLDLYRFMTGMYIDMYQNPNVYEIDYIEIEEAMHRQSWRQAEVSAAYHKQKARMNKLNKLERTYLPRFLLNRFLKLLNPDQPGTMDRVQYEKLLKKGIFSKYKYSLTENEFWGVLSRCGLDVSWDGNTVTFSNRLYPKMFFAISEWQRLLAPNRKGAAKYKYDSAFRHLDYRIFLPDYKITFESSQWYMSDEEIDYLTEIAALLSELGLKLKKADNTQSAALGCDYKGKHLVWFNRNNTYLKFRVFMFQIGSPEWKAFEEAVNQLPNAELIRAFCLKHFHRCRKCGCHPLPPSQLGCWVELFGKKINICGGNLHFETQVFDDHSLSCMKTLIRIRYQIIKQQNS